MYSSLGSMMATALMKLSPVHRNLTELEVTNVRDFFNSDFISPERRRQLDRLSAFMMTYVHAIRRTTQISKQARQDYYALQRQGCFAVKELPKLETSTDSANTCAPILVIPGLNTPSVFFREMHGYFTGKGYRVSVMDLPSNGFADLAISAQAVSEEVERLKAHYGAPRINLVGHCLGGLIAHYWLEYEANEKPSGSVQNLISLGTGFMGAEGVQKLKDIWIPRNPDKPIPKVFDELIQANMNMVRRSTAVARHNMLTIWDFMVHFRKGLLEMPGDSLSFIENHIIEDPAIDHLTLVLNHSVFQRMETILANPMMSDSPGLQSAHSHI